MSFCTASSGSTFHRWSLHFRRVLLANTTSPVVSSLAHGNMFGLVRLALRSLRKSDWIFLPPDKQPGYAALRAHEVPLLDNLAFPLSLYEPTAWSTLDVDKLEQEYFGLARAIGRYHDDARVSNNIKSSSVGQWALNVGCTVKKHKVPGAQSVRCIHRGFSPATAGLSSWVCGILEPFLRKIPWFAKDSFESFSAIRACTVSSSSVAAIIDLESFFLSGESHHIARVLSDLIQGDSVLRSLLFRTLFFLLENQFVRGVNGQNLYRCFRGGGIGLKHSPVVTNLFFFELCEKHVIPKYSGSHFCWTRYHDDVCTFLPD
jgi:hypothetical protein